MAPISLSQHHASRRWSVQSTPSLQAVVLHEIEIALDIPADLIDLNVSFLELGGHSLSAIDLVSACKSQDVSISVEDVLLGDTIGGLLHSAQWADQKLVLEDVAMSPTQCGVKRTADSTLLLPPSKKQHGFFHQAFPLTPPCEEVQTSMTEMQQTFVQGSQANPGTNIISFIEKYAATDIPIMKRAWLSVLQAESIFRTKFEIVLDDAILLEQIHAIIPWDEVTVNTQAEYQSELESVVSSGEVFTSFKVVNWASHCTDSDTSTIIWQVHHALIDGFSAALLYKKVKLAAAGLPTTSGTPFTVLARSLQSLQNTNHAKCEDFWHNRQDISSRASGDILLPKPASSTTFKKNAATSISIALPFEKISDCARRAKVSTVAFYHAAWAMVLSKYNDSDDVVFGVVLAGRNLPVDGANDSIGPLVNTLPLHVNLNRATTVARYLREVFQEMVALGSVQYSRPQDGFKREFSSALTTEFEMEAAGLDNIQPVGDAHFEAVTDIPLSIYISSSNALRLCYHRDTFSKRDISRLGEHFLLALHKLSLLDSTMGDCMDEMLTSESNALLRKIGNGIADSTLASSVSDDLVTMFERAVSQYPKAIALEKGSETLTYEDMNAKADIISQHLSRVAKPGAVICVNADRSSNWIISIYGILKAGCVYCPQDKALPTAVRNTNYQTAAAQAFVVSSSTDKNLAPESCAVCFSVDELLATSSVQPAGIRDDRTPTPSASAYICFTSGSTGKPKGVICTHEGLVAFQRDPEVRLFAGPGRKVSQIMAPAFDGSIHEIFSALSYGATLVLPDSIDPVSHLRSVDSAILTPSIAQKLSPSDFPKLKTLYLVGEPVPQPVNDLWSAQKQLYNMYGPTEGTGGATIKKLLPGEPVTIGGPNPSSRVYILDRNQRLVPPGVAGEIFLAGVQVARGYIARPDETRNRFFPDHIFGTQGEQMYKTGDRGYWNSSGEVICIGRNDRQIKLRGFRLDLNDIEIRVAQAVPELTAVAITRKEDYLVAMIQPASLNVAQLRSRIAKVLQTHAMPRLIEAVDKFPMTPIGKIDYKEIARVLNPATKSTSKQPISPTEKIVIDAWREALHLPSDVIVDGDSNFSDLGGHSLAQLLLASRLSNLFSCQISFGVIATTANLRELGQAIEQLKGPAQVERQFSTIAALGRHVVSPMEREWWLKYRLNSGTSAFNVNFVCALDRSVIDVKRLETAWNTVLARHDILRCRYTLDHEEGLLRTYAATFSTVRRAFSADVEREINRPFKLHRSRPIRVTLTQHILIVVVSHIVCDLTTLQLLLKEVQSIYNGTSKPMPSHTYSNTTVWGEMPRKADLDFWSRHLEKLPTCNFGLPMSSTRSSYQGRSSLSKVPKDIHKRLVEFTNSQKISHHQMALAAVALALQNTTEDIDIMLGGPYLNRPTAADLETVGLYLEPIPFRIRHSPRKSETCHNFLKTVQESSNDSLSHHVPWAKLLKHLEIKSDFPNHPLLETMVTFHADPKALDVGLPGVEPLLTWTQGSKFKLLAEFMAVNEETLLLRLEFDDRIFQDNNIEKIRCLVLRALELLMEDRKLCEVRDELKTPNGRTMKIEGEYETVKFGTRLSEL